MVPPSAPQHAQRKTRSDLGRIVRGFIEQSKFSFTLIGRQQLPCAPIDHDLAERSVERPNTSSNNFRFSSRPIVGNVKNPGNKSRCRRTSSRSTPDSLVEEERR